MIPQRCIVLTRSRDAADSLVRAPHSPFILTSTLPVFNPDGAYVYGCEGLNGYDAAVNARVGGATTLIGWRLLSGDRARSLVDILVDSPDPFDAVRASLKTFTPASTIAYVPPTSLPPPRLLEQAHIVEEPVPGHATTRTGFGPWAKSMYTLVRDTAVDEDVAPAFMLALVHVESGFNPNAVSRAGAMGLAQLMPSTAAHFHVTQPFHPQENLLGAITYLKILSGRVTDPYQLLAAYHSGYGGLQKHGITEADWTYIRRVVTQWRMYEKVLGDALIHEDPIGTALTLKKLY